MRASAFGVVAVLAVALAGQRAQQTGQTKSDRGQEVVRGCVIAGDGGYVVRDSNGEQWALAESGASVTGNHVADGATMKAYLGYEVVVSGEPGGGRRTLRGARVEEVIGSCMAEPNLMYQPED